MVLQPSRFLHENNVQPAGQSAMLLCSFHSHHLLPKHQFKATHAQHRILPCSSLIETADRGRHYDSREIIHYYITA